MACANLCNDFKKRTLYFAPSSTSISLLSENPTRSEKSGLPNPKDSLQALISSPLKRLPCIAAFLRSIRSSRLTLLHPTSSNVTRAESPTSSTLPLTLPCHHPFFREGMSMMIQLFYSQYNATKVLNSCVVRFMSTCITSPLHKVQICTLCLLRAFLEMTSRSPLSKNCTKHEFIAPLTTTLHNLLYITALFALFFQA